MDKFRYYKRENEEWVLIRDIVKIVKSTNHILFELTSGTNIAFRKDDIKIEVNRGK